tara:strand:+ start:116 stop:241 length:126 start_codon:yes stop_codon:yes gene_type:complete
MPDIKSIEIKVNPIKTNDPKSGSAIRSALTTKNNKEILIIG